MTFLGFDEKDGEPLYDSKESAIDRAKMMRTWGRNPDAVIAVQRRWAPGWFAHLVRETLFEFLAYYEDK